MKEIFKSLVNYENIYEISNFGRIKSLERYISFPNREWKQFKPEVIRKTKLNNSGYEIINLSKNGKTTTKTIHRLVALNFIDNLENKPQINHKDMNKQNNNHTNLEWCTAQENIKHAFENGRKHPDSFIKKRKFYNKKRHINRRMHNNFKVGQEQGDLLVLDFEGTEYNRSYFTVKCRRCNSIRTHIKLNDNSKACQSCAMKKSTKKRFYLKNIGKDIV